MNSSNFWCRLSSLDTRLKKVVRRLLTVKSILINLTWIIASVFAGMGQVDRLFEAVRGLI